MSANERQVGGDHYKTGGEEHWDRVVRLKLDYFQGQITKYIERAPKKNGKQDVEKAIHFCEKYLEVFEQMYPPKPKDHFEALYRPLAKAQEEGDVPPGYGQKPPAK